MKIRPFEIPFLGGRKSVAFGAGNPPNSVRNGYFHVEEKCEAEGALHAFWRDRPAKCNKKEGNRHFWAPKIQIPVRSGPEKAEKWPKSREKQGKRQDFCHFWAPKNEIPVRTAKFGQIRPNSATARRSRRQNKAIWDTQGERRGYIHIE